MGAAMAEAAIDPQVVPGKPGCALAYLRAHHDSDPHQLAHDAVAVPPTTRRLPVRRWNGAPAMVGEAMAATEVLADEVLADEVPVALVYNGISHAVMLATPDDLEDFALGFSLSEGIVDCRTELYDIEVVCHGAGIELRMQLAAAAMYRLKSSRRMRTGKTGCGLCGIESLQQFDQAIPSVPCGGILSASALQLAMQGLCLFQDLHAATGAAHAAGWASANGSVQLVREDVGRHNALDKLIGAMARQGIASHSGFAVVTSRASYEMVQKAARAGMPLLAAVSAPTAMAVRLADAAGLTLAGFVRAQRHVAYTHPQRIAEC